jgi:hypothetical protein
MVNGIKIYHETNRKMDCWHCGNELIWGGDHDIPDEDPSSLEYSMVTNLSCMYCNSSVLVYYPRQGNST